MLVSSHHLSPHIGHLLASIVSSHHSSPYIGRVLASLVSSHRFGPFFSKLNKGYDTSSANCIPNQEVKKYKYGHI